MSQRILIAPLLVVIVLVLNLSEVLACGGSKKILSPAEQAKSEHAFDSQRKAVQGRNIRAIDKALSKSKVSTADRGKVKELRDEAARLSEAGKLDDANNALREAWKLLGHPELFVVVAQSKC